MDGFWIPFISMRLSCSQFYCLLISWFLVITQHSATEIDASTAEKLDTLHENVENGMYLKLLTIHIVEKDTKEKRKDIILTEETDPPLGLVLHHLPEDVTADLDPDHPLQEEKNQEGCLF